MSDWIDVSVPLRVGMVQWPGDRVFEIQRECDMGRGDEMNLSHFATSAHTGTHMDAPLHFVDGGASIDQAPLDALIGRARVIGFPGEITIAELEARNIGAGERLLFRTRNSDRGWPDLPFFEDFVSIPEDAALWLAHRRPALIGVDYLSVGSFENSGPTHRAILGAGIWVVEGLNLSRIEPGHYELVCLPLKLMGAEGAPARAALRRL